MEIDISHYENLTGLTIVKENHSMIVALIDIYCQIMLTAVALVYVAL